MTQKCLLIMHQRLSACSTDTEANAADKRWMQNFLVFYTCYIPKENVKETICPKLFNNMFTDVIAVLLQRERLATNLFNLWL